MREEWRTVSPGELSAGLGVEVGLKQREMINTDLDSASARRVLAQLELAEEKVRDHVTRCIEVDEC